MTDKTTQQKKIMYTPLYDSTTEEIIAQIEALKQEEKTYYEQVATEEEFLEWYKKQDLPTYEKPSVTTDMTAFTFIDNELKLLMIQRGAHPYRLKYALPGGFVGSHESAEQAVLREVKEETNITINLEQIEQLKTVSTPGRDPRTWIITIGYIVYLPYEQVLEMQAQDDALEVKLITVNVKDNAFYDGDKLLTKDDFAFDHYDLIQEAISRMQGHDSWKPNFFQMLGYEFTVTEILNLVKAILPDKNLIRQNVLREYKKFIIEVGVRRKEGVKSQKTYKYKK